VKVERGESADDADFTDVRVELKKHEEFKPQVL